jgi:hypothetical protein
MNTIAARIIAVRLITYHLLSLVGIVSILDKAVKGWTRKLPPVI